MKEAANGRHYFVPVTYRRILSERRTTRRFSDLFSSSRDTRSRFNLHYRSDATSRADHARGQH
jgi:hypothetical protein